jgi:hypothetical protein
MRTTLSLLLVSAVLCGLSASTALAAPPAQPEARPDANQSPPDDAKSNAKVQTTPEANRESVAGAAKAPLRDLNLIRTQVPDVLLQALADPYARPTTRKCQELVGLIQPLNDALGADLDIPPTEEEQNMYRRGRPVALGAMASVASDVIPFRGVVRQLSGAAKHDEYVQAAIVAGFSRRAYLKGLGEARGCQPPATPSHVLAGRAPPPVNAGPTRGIKPRYPTR